MRFMLCVFVALSSSLALTDEIKRAGTRQNYSQGYASGARQSGSAQSQREVRITDGSSATQVGENYYRRHGYQAYTPGQGTTNGAYGNNGQASRTYYHNGDPNTKQQIQAYETKRIPLLNNVDSLYTRAEKAKSTLYQNPSMTKSERKNFERELDLISYEIGEIGVALGNKTFRKNHPDQRNEIKDDLFDIMWSQSPNRYIPVFLDSRMKTVDWQLTYLKELQTSMNTPFAEYKAQDRRDIHGEIQRDLEEIKRSLQSMRR